MISSCVYRIELLKDGIVVGIIEAPAPLPVPQPGSIITVPTDATFEQWERRTFLVENILAYHYDSDTAATVEIQVKEQ